MSPDPLSEVIALLRPRSVFSKGISGAGRWAVRYSDFGNPSFCAVLEGQCHLSVDGHPAILLQEGDFLLLPATPGFTMSGSEPVEPVRIDPAVSSAPMAEVRHGSPDGPPDVRILGGYFLLDSPEAALLVEQMRPVIHVRGVERLSMLVKLLFQESIAPRPGRELVLTRLVEVLLVEALRLAPSDDSPPGLLRGLADPHVASALRRMHGHLERAWTVGQLAKAAGLSRSAFFDRFSSKVGMPPMAYLLAWRMTVAKGLLRQEGLGMTEIAERVGYGSPSAFSTAFRREVGRPPRSYARAESPR